jgi:hypothetical protein
MLNYDLQLHIRCNGIPDASHTHTDSRSDRRWNSSKIIGETGGSAGDKDAALGAPIAFFADRQSISSEKGFSRNSDTPSCSISTPPDLGYNPT